MRSLIPLVVVSLTVELSAQPELGAAMVEPHPASREPYRFFDDRTESVPLLIYVPEAVAPVIRAELVQLTATLAVPVRTDVDVPLPDPGPRRSWIATDVLLSLPAVKRETDFEVRFRSRRQGDADWHFAGRVRLRVYPSDLLSPIRVWAQSHSLRVEDDLGSVIQFLREQQIPLAARSGRGGVTFYSGAQALQTQARTPLGDGETVVLFPEREREIPHLSIDHASRGTIIRVEMRLLDRLFSDPLAQKLLLEVFQHLHEQALPEEGVHR